ncbi:Pre-mRNA-splicing factor Cwf15/Cwc15 [Absidia repens]|uniref:Pre-mRNA-splicing factor Cwf15/Cwc15 n=1 Tax=Absidia repens TaxID=90262 RepID=A0A1X2IVQ7_9FUNG|nr:Pre-mRNA-splicing factor Cwf15/Cwc15 [Absidia repens]
MTTAARPTFDPARGNDSKAPSFQYSARDIASHTKLKFRQPGQGTPAEIGDRERLKEELRRAEIEYYESQGKTGISSDRLLTGDDGGGGGGGGGRNQDGTADEVEDPVAKRKRLLAEAEKMAALDKEDSDDDDESGDSSDDDDDDDDESDDDENTAELLATLQRIRKERAEEKERQEREKLEQEAAQRDEEAMTGNPLLNIGEQQNRDFSVKRRWDDDVIFKNQARGTDEKPNKRFVNDMLRSDFHRRFLHKYIQ